MSVCYSIETLEFPDPAFKNIACYLITMADSPRREQYMEELRKHRPAPLVHIVNNTGFKRCDKGSGVTTTAHDLWHANLYIMSQVASDARPVLILEDDVQFTDEFRKRAREVEEFIHKNSTIHAYNLGCCSFLSVPYGNHVRSFLTGDAHAVVYTPSGRAKLEGFKVHIVHDLEMSVHLKTFTSLRPLAVQRKTQTDNSRTWNLYGIPLWYYNLFEDQYSYYETHHALGRFGGLSGAPIMIALVLVPLIMLKARSTVKKSLYNIRAHTCATNVRS
jgi:hypothetical protein